MDVFVTQYLDTNKGAGLAQTIRDQEGFLTRADIQCLYLHIKAFFIAQQQYLSPILTRANLMQSNLEQDVQQLWTEST